MNATIFWRILWKEYRAQRAFWISMVVLTVLAELLLLAGYRHSFFYSLPERIQPLFAAGLALAAFYALGSGATLFAAERETETYDFLRGLPVTPLVVFAGKVVFALASTVALFLLAWTVALALARELPDPLFHRQIWALCGLGGIELLAWGILFSLLLKRPLVAVICAVTVVSIILWFLGGESNRWMAVDLNPKTVYARLLIVALMAATDIALALRWFRERSPLTARLRSARAREATGWGFDLPPSSGTMLCRLVWQELRQSAALTAALMAMLLPIVLLGWAQWLFPIDPRHLDAPGFGRILSVLLLPGFLAAPLLGSSVFLADQTDCRFRFLAECGIPPRLVWLSRQIRGLAIMLLGLLLVLVPEIAVIAGKKQPDGMLLVIERLVGFVVVAYVCGQLCSMVFRSGILAATFGTILTLLLCGWAALMYGLGLSWLWSVAPIPLAFMVATWLHAPDWILERKTGRARLRSALVVAIPAVTIVVAIPLVRVYEIPLVGPGFDVEELTRPVPPEQQETLALYERANDELRQSYEQFSTKDGVPTQAWESARRKAEEQAVTLALEASRRPLFPITASDPEEEINLGDLVFASGKRLESEGKLDAALDRYVAAERIALSFQEHWHAHHLEMRVREQLVQWVAQSGQTSQRALQAVRSMEQLWRNPPSYSDAIKHEYLQARRFLEGDPVPSKYQYRYDKDSNAFLRWFPWERARALRLLNKLTAEKLARYRKTEEALAAGGFVDQPSDENVSPALYRDITYTIVRPMITPFTRIVVDGRGRASGYLGDSFIVVETHRRATVLILALEAWKLEHGGLPKSLEALKGKYLDQLPVDPYRGSPFMYEPKGIAQYLVWWTPDSSSAETFGPGQPFLACDSWTTLPHGTGSEDNLGMPKPPEDSVGGSPRTELWERVWVFAIP